MLSMENRVLFTYRILQGIILERSDYGHANVSARWGKELSLMKELQFARIQPFKWYIWSLGILPGPDMAEERIELAKSVSFIYMIDDIFDVYGTPDELILFTEAVNRYVNLCIIIYRILVLEVRSRKKYGVIQ